MNIYTKDDWIELDEDTQEDAMQNNVVILNKSYNLARGFSWCPIRENIIKNGKAVFSTGNNTKLIAFLVENEGKLISDELILKNVWGSSLNQDTRFKETNTLKVTLKNIRDKTYFDIIENIKGVGYKIEFKRRKK